MSDLASSSDAPLRVLVAPDKYKGTLSSAQVARAISNGLKRAWPSAQITTLTLTDGGEGFVEVMARQTKGHTYLARTTDALGRFCRARWGVLGTLPGQPTSNTAVIGLSNASGIAQIPYEMRNPELTTNAGTGRIISLAIQRGHKEILVGLGGSATTEGGISLAALALGYCFLDKNDQRIPLTGSGLYSLHKIIPPNSLPDVKFIVATDVSNPLFGPQGAAYQFSAQKGANPDMIRRLDDALRNLAEIVKRDVGVDVADSPGAGSAGGCGYGLMAFFKARREQGFELIRRVTQLDELVAEHDLIVTGEGRFDGTSLLGKAPVCLAQMARDAHKPIWAFCGRVDFEPNNPTIDSPFHLIAALSTPSRPGPRISTITPEHHISRLANLAYSAAQTAPVAGRKTY